MKHIFTSYLFIFPIYVPHSNFHKCSAFINILLTAPATTEIVKVRLLLRTLTACKLEQNKSQSELSDKKPVYI